MTEEFNIQCENCGTLYSDREEVCPYCGQPPPLLYDDEPAAYDDLTVAEFNEAHYPTLDDGLFVEDEYAGVDDRFERTDEGGTYEWYPEVETYEQDYASYPIYEDDLELEDEAEISSRRFTWSRLMLGCLGLFACISLLYGTVALVAAYNGLRERAANTQAEAQQHYRRGQEHLGNNELDLAIAEFEMALSLNPNFLAARQALRDAQNVIQNQPTPTSETRLAAAAELLKTAETQVEEEDWEAAVQTLVQIQDLDPDFQTSHVSELLYTASYQLGLQLLTPDRVEEAAAAFERALNERPDDPAAQDELTKASLYVEGRNALASDRQKAVDTLSLLYRKDPAYLDVKEQLIAAHDQRGDELAADGDWCLAEVQYVEAADLESSAALQEKVKTSTDRCQENRIRRPADTSVPKATPTLPIVVKTDQPEAAAASLPSTAETTKEAPAPAETGGGSGSIIYSAYNPAEKRWEILSVPATGGTPKLLTINGTMPAVSPDGQHLIYHSELLESEGFHRFDLATGEDSRITLYKYHILPRWAGDNKEFLFVAQEPGTGRWQIWLGFADGKGQPVILRDGRTPDWSPDKSQIAYQGTDPEGNNPGIYLVPFGGGEPNRLTTHESDRSPDFSPDGSRLAYMSTQDGSWNIYTISVSGGQPRRLTTDGGNHGLPVWSPDGSQLAYVADTGGNWGIYVINANGGTPTRVSSWDGTNLPDWLLAQIAWTR